METAIEVKERPILFSTPMVQAILEGRKTMTRRVVKPQFEFNPERQIMERNERYRGFNWVIKHQFAENPDRFEIDVSLKCPYGKVGDILWVRETFVKAGIVDEMSGKPYHETLKYYFKADDEWAQMEWDHPDKEGPQSSPRWKPSIHMPKKACRLFLEITDIRIERLQDITEEDAIAEGVQPNCDETGCPSPFCKTNGCQAKGEYFHYQRSHDDFPANSAIESFQSLWSKINGPESWDLNPWVWVISFKQITK